MAHKFPPKGYRMKEFPLPHEFRYDLQLNPEDDNTNTSILSLLRADESCLDASTINVNPSHLSFAEETGPTCNMGSIVPKISIDINAFMTVLARETHKMKEIIFQWAPIYTAFLDTLVAEDVKTGTEIEDIVELQHTTADKEVLPLWEGTKIGANQPLSTINKAETYTTFGLTTDATLENVAFVEDDYFDAKSYYSNAGMLNKVMPKMNTARVSHERGYHYHSNNFTNPLVKRINPYTFCGIMIHMPQCNNVLQPVQCGDITEHDAVAIKVQVRYDEWNPQFDQTEY